jgi:hypothetical protein
MSVEDVMVGVGRFTTEVPILNDDATVSEWSLITIYEAHAGRHFRTRDGVEMIEVFREGYPDFFRPVVAYLRRHVPPPSPSPSIAGSPSQTTGSDPSPR